MKVPLFQGIFGLSGPISHDTAILSLQYPISRMRALPQNGAIPTLWFLVSHRHICAIPHFATYRVIAVRYPTKTSMEEFCDTIAASIARYQKYRCWASKPLAFSRYIHIVESGASCCVCVPIKLSPKEIPGAKISWRELIL